MTLRTEAALGITTRNKELLGTKGILMSSIWGILGSIFFVGE